MLEAMVGHMMVLSTDARYRARQMYGTLSVEIPSSSSVQLRITTGMTVFSSEGNKYFPDIHTSSMEVNSRSEKRM